MKSFDFDSWPRKDHYLHFENSVPCAFSVTQGVDITRLLSRCKESNKRFHLTFIYILNKAVNEIDEFKFHFMDGRLATHEFLSAEYLLFHDDTKTYTTATTEYCPDFERYYDNLENDHKKYATCRKMTACDMPKNTFPTSCLPWLHYTSFNLNLPLSLHYYAPIITWGAYKKENRSIDLPLTIQLNHAVADGYHAGVFFKLVQGYCDTFPWH